MFKKISLTVTALALTVFYFYHDPSAHSFGPKCLIHETTSWYCWGCGGQRAFHALLHGQFAQAFQNNLLVYLVVFVLSIAYYSELFDDFRLFKYLRNRYFVIFLIIFVAAFTIIRNFQGFEFLIPTIPQNAPNRPPF
jgi:hypothetical protein